MSRRPRTRPHVLVVVGALMLLAFAWLITPPAWPGSKDLLSRYVVCDSTRDHVATANPNRANLTLQNVGTLHAGVGRGGQLFTLHVGTSIEFRDYQGGVDCQTQVGTGSTGIEVLEELNP